MSYSYACIRQVCRVRVWDAKIKNRFVSLKSLLTFCWCIEVGDAGLALRERRRANALFRPSVFYVIPYANNPIRLTSHSWLNYPMAQFIHATSFFPSVTDHHAGNLGSPSTGDQSAHWRGDLKRFSISVFESIFWSFRRYAQRDTMLTEAENEIFLKEWEGIENLIFRQTFEVAVRAEVSYCFENVKRP